MCRISSGNFASFLFLNTFNLFLPFFSSYCSVLFCYVFVIVLLTLKILIQSPVRIKIIIIKEHSWTQINDNKIYAKPNTQSSVSISIDIYEGIIQDENVQDKKKCCFWEKSVSCPRLYLILPFLRKYCLLQIQQENTATLIRPNKIFIKHRIPSFDAV